VALEVFDFTESKQFASATKFGRSGFTRKDLLHATSRQRNGAPGK